MKFNGVVVSGLDEGAFYVREYNKYFREHLQQEFFPGTLNIRTPEVIRLKNGVEIIPKEKNFSEVRCYKVRINDALDGFIVVPAMRRHPEDILEIMAGENLRERFNLKNGDTIACELA